MKKLIISGISIFILLASIHLAFSIMDMGLGTFKLTDIYSTSYLAEKGKPAEYYSDVMIFDKKPETAWCKAREEKDKTLRHSWTLYL